MSELACVLNQSEFRFLSPSVTTHCMYVFYPATEKDKLQGNGINFDSFPGGISWCGQ